MSLHLGAREPGDLALDTDVVVVGSGASGAVVARELADAGQRVLILEEGGYYSPETYGALRPSQQMRAMWRDGGLTFAFGLGDSPMVNVMMGKCVGGSSVLTGGVCFRTPDAVLREWQQVHGLTDLTPERMAPFFEAVEKRVHVEEVPRRMRSKSTELFAVGAEKLGYALKPLRRNTEGCQGFSRCNFGCPHRAKLSVDVSYLPDALRQGAELFSDCLVERVLVENGRAVGIEGRVLNGPDRAPSGRLWVRAKRVVLAAGAYHSPLLLLRSGLAPLFGQVGKNLTLHPSFRVMARFDEPVNGWRGALQSAFSDAFEHERFTLISVFTPPGVLAATMPGIGPEHVAHAEQVPYLSVFGGLVHDSGGGRVRRGIGREPLVTYRLSKEDRHAVWAMLRKMADTYFAAGAREVYLPVLGLPGMTADALARFELEKLPARRLECSSQHPMGTCRMGTSPKRSVVDPLGQHWQVKDLFVVDGSITPTSLGVNPQLTIMAMALRLATRLRERLS